MFAYSLREKTHAHRKLSDDVPEAVKKRRLREVIEVFNAGAREANDEEVGRHHLLLVERVSKKSEGEWVGRTDTNPTNLPLLLIEFLPACNSTMPVWGPDCTNTTGCLNPARFDADVCLSPD